MVLVETLIHAGAPSSGAAEDCYRRQARTILIFDAAVVHDDPVSQETDASATSIALLSTPTKQIAVQHLTPSTGRTDRSDLVQDSQDFSLPPLHRSAHAAQILPSTQAITQAQPDRVSELTSVQQYWQSRFSGVLDETALLGRPSAFAPRPVSLPPRSTLDSDKHTSQRSTTRTRSPETHASPSKRNRPHTSPDYPTNRALLKPAFVEAEARAPFYCADAAQMLQQGDSQAGFMPPPLSPARPIKTPLPATKAKPKPAIPECAAIVLQDLAWRSCINIESFLLHGEVDSDPPFFPDFLLSLPSPKPKLQTRRLLDLERGYWSICVNAEMEQSDLDRLWTKLGACVTSSNLVWVSFQRIPGQIRVYCWARCAMHVWVLIREYLKPKKLARIAWYDGEGKLVIER